MRQLSPWRVEAVITSIPRRIRAAIGIGLMWGATWGAAGVVLARVPGFHSDLPYPLIFAPLGFVSGLIFSGALVAHTRRYGPASASVARFALWGAASGLLLAGMFVIGAALRGAGVWREFLLFGPTLASASAICAAGSRALAMRAERRELSGRGGAALTTRPKIERAKPPDRSV